MRREYVHEEKGRVWVERSSSWFDGCVAFPATQRTLSYELEKRDVFLE